MLGFFKSDDFIENFLIAPGDGVDFVRAQTTFSAVAPPVGHIRVVRLIIHDDFASRPHLEILNLPSFGTQSTKPIMK